MSRIGDPSSKYGYHPERLDLDVADKAEVGRSAYACIKAAVSTFIRADYRYSDNMPMSLEAKWEITMMAMRDVKEEYGM